MRNEIYQEDNKGAKVILSATCLILALQIASVLHEAKIDKDMDIKEALRNDFDHSVVDELIYENHISSYINDLYQLDDYLKLSKKLNKLSVLKNIEVTDFDIEDTELLEPEEIYALIDLLHDKSQAEETAQLLKIEEALVNEYIYNFAFNEAPKISEIITKAQILDNADLDEYEIKRLTITSYESVCLNHDLVKKIGYVTGVETYSADKNSDLGKFRILTLKLTKSDKDNYNPYEYNKDINDTMDDYLKLLNRVLLNDYQLKDTYGGHVKKLVKSK